MCLTGSLQFLMIISYSAVVNIMLSRFLTCISIFHLDKILEVEFFSYKNGPFLVLKFCQQCVVWKVYLCLLQLHCSPIFLSLIFKALLEAKPNCLVFSLKSFPLVLTPLSNGSLL